MADLIVDASLDQTNADLKSINNEFQDIYSNADLGGSVYGQQDLASAMHEFADNWWVHRGKIQDSLQGLSNQVDKASSNWNDADNQLSQSLETQSSGPAATPSPAAVRQGAQYDA